MSHLPVISSVCLLAAAGCAVVPTTRSSVRRIGTESAIVEPADSKLALATTYKDGELAVRATRHGTCKRQQIAIDEHRAARHATFHTPKDPRVGILAFILAPLTIPTSAVYTAVAVHSSGTRRIEKHVIASKPFSCTTPSASLAVELSLPSGRRLERTTDAAGERTVEVLLKEPYRGKVTIVAGGQNATIDYARPMPAVTALREAVRTCVARAGVVGSIGFEVDVDADGAVTAARADTATDLGACITDALALVRFPTSHRDARLAFRLAF